MSKYRKKPVIVEAFEYDGDLVDSNGDSYVPDWAMGAYGGGTIRYGKGPDEKPYDLYIETLEGKHLASVGDFIIKGVKGEIYPCKPDIFKMTYEEMEE